jgi:hypothetical protein
VLTIKTAPLFCVCSVYDDKGVVHMLVKIKAITPLSSYTEHTQKNGAALIVNTIITAPFFCVCPVYDDKGVEHMLVKIKAITLYPVMNITGRTSNYGLLFGFCNKSTRRASFDEQPP